MVNKLDHNNRLNKRDYRENYLIGDKTVILDDTSYVAAHLFDTLGKTVNLKSTKVASMTLGFSRSDAGHTCSCRSRAPRRREVDPFRESRVSGRSRENDGRTSCTSNGWETEEGWWQRGRGERARVREREGEERERDTQ